MKRLAEQNLQDLGASGDDNPDIQPTEKDKKDMSTPLFSFDILLIYFSVQALSSKGTTPKNPKPKSLKSRFEGTTTTEEVADTATAKVQPRKLNKTQTGSMKDELSMGAYPSSPLLEPLPIHSFS